MVVQGRLQLEWANASDTRLDGLYGKNTALFKSRLLEHLNESLAGLNLLVDWRSPRGDSFDGPIRDQLTPGLTPEAANSFSGPLHVWLQRFAPSHGTTFYDWRPTQPAEPTAGDPASADEKIYGSTREVLSNAAGDLIVKIREDDMEDPIPGVERLLKVWFAPPISISRVQIGGVNFAEAIASVPADRWHIDRLQEEKLTFERELSAGTNDIRLSWNDGLAVQRMRAILRARGMWSEFAPGARGSSRMVHWLSFNQDQTVATVHLPHLCYIVFEPGADTDEVVEQVARILLRSAEFDAVCDSLKVPRTSELGTASGAQKEAELLSQSVSRHGERRMIDLFALAGYLQTRRTNQPDLYYSPLPVRQDWLASAQTRIEERGYIVSSQPVVTTEDRLIMSAEKTRLENESGGIEIWISPRPTNRSPAANHESGVVARSSRPGKKRDDESWLKQQRLRAEFGASLESSESPTFIARLSTIDKVALGQIAAELQYKERVSGALEWRPGFQDQQDASLMPSALAVFSDSTTPRLVDRREISLERQGVRSNKRIPLRQDVVGAPERSLELSAQIARVRDLSSRSAPSANELSASAGFVTSAAPNPWDARSYRSLRARASVTGRGRSRVETWSTLETSAQIRIPRGEWSYFGSIDAKWVVGSPPADALPYVGGFEGVRGLEPYSVPAQGRIIVRNELWAPFTVFRRDYGSQQQWFGSFYEMLKPALFVDTGWASEPRAGEPVTSWSVSPGVGLRLLLGPANVNFDYAYGIVKPTRLGSHHFTVGLTARY